MPFSISATFNVSVGLTRPAGTFSYFWGNSSPNHACRVAKAADLDNDGVDEVIFAAFECQPNSPSMYTNTQVQIFDWVDGKLKNMTSTWLPNFGQRVEGVGDIQFGDFNGDGQMDVFLSGYADMDYRIHAYALMNKGGYFEKTDLGLCSWQHGSYAYDVNKDGYTDVMATGYGTDAFRMYLGGPNGLSTYQFTGGDWAGGSGVALGDFFGDGSTSVILVDWGVADHFRADTQDLSDAKDTALLRLSLGTDGKSPALTFTNSLPLPRLELPKYGNLANGQYDNSHDIRALGMDFNADGLTDVLVFSRGGWNGQTWPRKSEVQFLQNKGNGQFDDVTDTIRSGFVSDAAASYSARVGDFNQDGLPDIFSNDQDSPNSTFLLMGDPSGKFIDTGRKSLSGLGGKASSALAKGPNGTYYIVAETDGNINGKVVYAPVTISRADVITGTASDDTLQLSSGVAKVYGLAGSDTFKFVPGSTLDADKKSAPSIMDFKTREADKLDLSSLFESATIAPTWLKAAPSPKQDATNTVWFKGGYVSISTDADNTAELYIKLVGVAKLDASSLIL